MSNLRLFLSSAAVTLTACLLFAASANAQPVTMKIGHATTKGAYDNWAGHLPRPASPRGSVTASRWRSIR